jgi:hypothetical protein
MGSGIHNAMALHYTIMQKEGSGPFDVEERTKILQKAFVAEIADEIKSGRFPTLQEQSHDKKRYVIKAFDILHEYLVTYPYEQFSVKGIEEPFAIIIPVKAVIGGKKISFELIYVGRMDLIIEMDKRQFVVDHKTSSMLTPMYLDTFRPNHQITGYILACRELTGKDVKDALVNAIGVYKVGTRFARKRTRRTNFEIDSFKKQMKEVTLRILMGRDRVENGEYYETVFPQNPQSCNKWNTLCQFSMICKKFSKVGRKNLINGHYKKEVWVPYEIEAEERFESGPNIEFRLE